MSLDWLLFTKHALASPKTNSVDDVAVVFMNDGASGDWTPYSTLVSQLSKWHAKAVVFDLIFTNAAWNAGLPAFGAAVSNAAAASGMKVGLASVDVIIKNTAGTRHTELLLPSMAGLVSQLGTNATIGLANLEEHGHDGIIRTYSLEHRFGRDPLALAVARMLKSDRSLGGGFFWLNYHGPPGVFPQYSSLLAPDANALASSFSNKVVFVGEASAADRHKTPFAHSAEHESSGVEIHATAYANIAQGECISGFRTISQYGDSVMVLLVGVLSGYFFLKWTPLRAFTTAIGCAVLVLMLAYYRFTTSNWLLPWLVIVAVQLPLAFLVSWMPVKSVFISYRAAGERDQNAAAIADGLEKLGIEVYFDKDDDTAGFLENVLLPEVEKRENLILVVTDQLFNKGLPGSPDWVGEELARAALRGRLVLPVFVFRPDSVHSSPPYVSLHSPSQQVVLGSILGGSIREVYNYDAQHRRNQLQSIARKLRCSVRRNWRKPATSTA